MKYIILYLHVHQPYRLRDYSIFDIGNRMDYFHHEDKNTDSNRDVFNKVAYKSYYPTNEVLQRLLNKYPDFKVNFSITGTFIEQAQKYDPGVLETFQNLVKTHKVEILAETYYHSLASLYSYNEFERQVREHEKIVKKIFKLTPKYFRNTELIYSDFIAKYVEKMQYKGIIAEGTEKILHWRSPNHLYKTNSNKGINLLLKNYKLSDDIAWRFSDKNWVEHPLSSHKYMHWLDNTPGEVINLFMDYETFGEHQWEDTGIFKFMESFAHEAINRGYKFINFSDTDKYLKPKDTVECPFVISWADAERDTSAWTENSMQQDMLNKIYSLEREILATNNKQLLKIWKYLQISDHYYYMCTKWFTDGDAHAYFSPYKSPYQAYNNFNNVLIDLKQRLKSIRSAHKKVNVYN